MQDAIRTACEDVMEPTAEIRDEGDHLVLVNRNPSRRNALSAALYDGIRRATAQAAAEPRIGAVVLAGEGDFFCAGGDLTQLIKAQDMPEADRRARIEDLADVIRAVRQCPRPVIAAVEGGAAGAGMSLALACDLVVAAKGAKFTASYVNAGLIPDGGLTAALVAGMPHQVAAELLLGGQPMRAERLHALGCVNLLAEPGTALAVAQAAAKGLAMGPANAQAAIKRLLTGAADALWEAQFAAEADAMAVALAAPEAAEGIGAFLGKRMPGYAALRRG